MSTPTYPKLDHYHPVIANNKIFVVNSARNNLMNIRDFLCLTGYMPGWNVQMYTSVSGVAPDYIVCFKNTEAVKIVFTWVSRDFSLNGSGNNYISKAAFYYSTDTQVTWQPLTDKSGNYVLNLTYDTEDNCTSQTWNTTP